MKILSTIITSPLLFKKSPKFHFSLKFPSPHNITNAKTNPQTLSRIAMATCIGAAQPSPFSGDPTRPQQGDSSAAAGTNGLNILKLSRRNFSDQVPKSTAASATAFQDVATARKPIRTVDYDGEVFSDRRNHLDEFWREIRSEAISDSDSEPVLKQYYSASILSHVSLESALANQLSLRLGSSLIPSQSLYEIFLGELRDEVAVSVRSDLRAAKERDPACISYVQCLLSFKGFLAIQAHRISNRLWSNGRKVLALTIQSRVSEVFAVDIHPGAIVGRGVLLDHATGVVVGETAVIGDQVSILHNVTLGGTGKSGGDRHPKIGNGVLIGAGTCILGNIRIGEGAKIGAGSVVLKDVPAWTTAVGNPARLLGGKNNPVRNDGVPGLTMDHTSNISDWSDYVI